MGDRQRRGAGARSKATVAPVSAERGDVIEGVVYRGSRRTLSRRDVHVALEPIVRAWLRAVCAWDNPNIGDFKFLIFSLEVAPETEVYVQFWSEPFEPVIWEVSSGTWNPPADEWLAGDRARRIEALGFSIGEKAENYNTSVEMRSPAAIAAVARTVAEIFYSGFDYRGRRPIHVKLVHDGRSEVKATYDSFTPEDVGKLFTGLGFHVGQPADTPDDEESMVIRCRKGRIDTMVELDNRVDDENLFRSMRFSADIALPTKERQRLKDAPDAPPGAEPYATVSVILPFGGGVTLAWLIERIHEWDRMLAEQRRVTRRRQRNPRPAVHVTDTVH